MRRLGFAVLWWALMFGLYLLLVTSDTGWEPIVGVGVAGVGAAAAFATARTERARFRPSVRWVAWLPRVALGVVVDSGRLAVLLVGHLARGASLEGRVRELQLPPAEDEPRAEARRAVATLALCATPGTVVVDEDREAATLTVHELGAAGALERVVTR